ncbi:MAG: AEC family transporter [Oscillospiraceae bacterium]|nr:AEC family transporter [Oscillospiraceae bacterium]
MLDILTRAGCFVAIIALGHILRRTGFFGPETFGLLSKIVMKITLPAALLASAAGKPIDASLLTISLLGLGGGVLYMGLGWLLQRKGSKQQQAYFIQNLPGYNIGTFALPFTQSFLGPVGVLTTSIFDLGNAFICFGGSFSIARAVKEGGKADFRRVLKAPLTSLPFLTHALMVFLNLNHLTPPKAIISFAEIVGGANAFLAMLMIGVGLNLSADRSKLGAMAKILSVRFGVAAVLALCYYYLLPFDLEVRQALVILAFSPIGSTVPVYTAELGEDVGLSSATNSAAIVISIVIIVTLLTVML